MLGNDVGTVNGTAWIVSRFDLMGLAGDDTFQFNSSVASTFVQARGGEGNDVFELAAESFGRSRVDGGENGDDSMLPLRTPVEMHDGSMFATSGVWTEWIH